MEGVYVGQQAGREHGPVLIKWQADNVSALGTTIGNNMHQDWDKVTEKIEKTFERWKNRQLSVKTVLIQTYAIATVTYLASMFLIPNLYVNCIHQAIFQFLWDNKNELVSLATCHLAMNQGGLGIPDIHVTRTISILKWIKHLTNKKTTSTWLQYGGYWTGQVLGGIKEQWKWLRSNLTPHGDPSKVLKWYKLLIEFVSEHR